MSSKRAKPDYSSSEEATRKEEAPKQKKQKQEASGSSSLKKKREASPLSSISSHEEEKKPVVQRADGSHEVFSLYFSGLPYETSEEQLRLFISEDFAAAIV